MEHTGSLSTKGVIVERDETLASMKGLCAQTGGTMKNSKTEAIGVDGDVPQLVSI